MQCHRGEQQACGDSRSIRFRPALGRDEDQRNGNHTRNHDEQPTPPKLDEEKHPQTDGWNHADRQPGGDVLFLGVDWTDTEKKAEGYLAKFGITYPNGPDLGTRISQAYRTTGVPETYIIDRDGVLAYVKFSPFLSIDEIKSAIDPLLEH